jgi:7,8-dihydropterin-6-yl-methyl-4-(beta-D-ribofuranosyl)aminobenzene 5'-phosphate synthase
MHVCQDVIKSVANLLREDDMVRTIFYLLSLAVALSYAFSASAQSEKRITILYDAFGPPSSLKMDWGFAALIEYNGRRILFDTGNNADI